MSHMDQKLQEPDSHNEMDTFLQGASLDETPSSSLSNDDCHVCEKSILEEFGPRGECPLSLPQEFTALLNGVESSEGKLECTLQFMQKSLEKGGGLHFKEFWDARKLCIAFFKESMQPTRRVQLWAMYSELCREARRLKELFDEQSAYFTEQMEMAIQGLKEDVDKLSVPEGVLEDEILQTELNATSALHDHQSEYREIQNKLKALNAFAQRTTALRKELIHADIKLRNKNRLFQQLSSLGDIIFPKRKELIQKISTLYLSDIERFIQSVFVGELTTVELFQIRDQIKQLQHIAKLLTLSTEVFNKTRLELSECWDSIKSVVKERKKTQTELRQEKRQQKEEVIQQLDELKKNYEEKSVDVIGIERAIRQLYSHIRSLSLIPPDVKYLKGLVKELEDRIRSDQEEASAARKDRVKEKEDEKNKKLQDWKLRVERGATHPEELDPSHMQTLEKELASFSLSRKEHYECEHLLFKVKNAIAAHARKKISSSLDLASPSLIEEKELLLHQKEELKIRLDSLRKEQGASGSNFAYALQLDEMIREERERLKEIEDSLTRLGKE